MEKISRERSAVVLRLPRWLFWSLLLVGTFGALGVAEMLKDASPHLEEALGVSQFVWRALAAFLGILLLLPVALTLGSSRREGGALPPFTRSRVLLAAVILVIGSVVVAALQAVWSGS